jgi:hypothetical protein
MKIHHKLKYSETFKIDSTQHLFTQKFHLKLYRSKEFDGEITNQTIKLNYFPRDKRYFLIGGALTITGNIKGKEILLEYNLSKEQIYWFSLVIGGITLSYLLNLIGLITIENPVNLWFCLISYLGIYAFCIILFHYYIKDCKERIKSFLLDES